MQAPSEVVVLVHPAPELDRSLLAVPGLHASALGAIDATAFALALQAGVQAWVVLFGVEPGFNICVLAGEAIGHVHAELVLRTHTNIPGGKEFATKEPNNAHYPEIVRRELRQGSDV